MNNAYLDTLDRLEAEIANVDQVTSLTSIAISLKRILLADHLEKITSKKV